MSPGLGLKVLQKGEKQNTQIHTPLVHPHIFIITATPLNIRTHKQRNILPITSLFKLKIIERVRLQDNNLSGKLSLEITQLPWKYLLDISGNKLSGRINVRKWNMPSVQMLNLANNNFSSDLPNSFDSNKVEGLDLSQNQFSGYIQIGFRNLPELVQLKLNNNNLFGKFPEELFQCNKLVSLDLSHNQLFGEIPDFRKTRRNVGSWSI
ncbi:leucine-rich receptor-like kinase family protein [Medicago truncatula]|uniref:Leucine-rich receptor-like kinase family protein n=1 Tax=Medicago truncatula TaxID=3880 RepID=A0A072UTG7_MEDTR|nr:leucine-rich receptor-like kinase family protein [Medicago truncatula]